MHGGFAVHCLTTWLRRPVPRWPGNRSAARGCKMAEQLGGSKLGKENRKLRMLESLLMVL